MYSVVRNVLLIYARGRFPVARNLFPGICHIVI